MRALSIRQPYAELILRGEKTIEFRSRPTKIIGERFYIYAAKKWAGVAPTTPTNGHAPAPTALTLPCPTPQGRGGLPTGVIVGTATITRCVQSNGHYEWHLTNVKRLEHPRKPKRMPQPVWFKPF
jgi:hypothetical protein